MEVRRERGVGGKPEGMAGNQWVRALALHPAFPQHLDRLLHRMPPLFFFTPRTQREKGAAWGKVSNAVVFDFNSHPASIT